ncbi:conserved hypothetical protein [Vibrio nigripulchritudo MADA3029]|uniref:hypothetical protein n=1 Tax=Vibrio nigripulchritudo TaxID=28173 RepID=UPI0003B1F640|nr:hypothetical protein [Vibrio nigripulchritudo]CCN48938.1 conserved hypothetical protein [Vibrio nigripulchritudo MADA3020]CCN53224.1 conserved hypothetical protein [Vibrio nigripulchritudo MADA3021]CCN56826.1 conserved hypothetical protein [Vibrio nigripulchritudo MADA3029]
MMPSLSNAGTMPIQASGSTGDFQALNRHKTGFQIGGIHMGSTSNTKLIVIGAVALVGLYLWKKK